MAQLPYSPTTIFRLPKVKSETGLSRSSIYQRIQAGLLPSPIKTGRISGWPAREITRVNEAVIQGRTNEQILELVRGLEHQRSA